MINREKWHLIVSLNGRDSAKASCDVCEMYACGANGDLFLGCIKPMYVDGFIAAMSEFASANNYEIDYLTKTFTI